MNLIEYLPWDSNFFGKRIGRVIINDEKSFDPKQFNEEVWHNFDLVYVFSNSTMLSFDKVTLARLDLVDIMVTMSMPFNNNQHTSNIYDFKISLDEDEILGCYEIAEQTSIVSRFYREPLIGPEKTKELYRKWIDNALNRTHSDGLFLSKENGIISGLLIIKTDINYKIGHCSLIGVRKDLKGKGIGRKLWEQAFNYWASKGCIRKCFVPFSAINIESFNFHLKMGFNKAEEIKYIYHYRNIDSI